MIKDKVKCVLVAVVSIFLCLVVAEFMLDKVFKMSNDYLSKIIIIKDNVKYLKPNATIKATGCFREFEYLITTNEYGFRNTTSRNGDFDILVIGDSQTFGVGVNDDLSYPAILGKIANKEVLNMGCPGQNNVEAYNILKDNITKFKPELVILGFFAGNDPYENYLANKRSFKVRVDLKRSHLSSMKKRLKKSSVYILLTKVRGIPVINKMLYDLHLVNPVPPKELVIFEKKDTDLKDKFWDNTYDALLRIKDLAKTNNAEFAILFIPDKFQVDEEYWSKWCKKYNLNRSDYDLINPNKRLTEFCKENNILFIDTTRALSETDDCYWKIDNHLNRNGNNVIANSIYSNMVKNELLQKRV